MVFVTVRVFVFVTVGVRVWVVFGVRVWGVQIGLGLQLGLGPGGRAAATEGSDVPPAAWAVSTKL